MQQTKRRCLEETKVTLLFSRVIVLRDHGNSSRHVWADATWVSLLKLVQRKWRLSDVRYADMWSCLQLPLWSSIHSLSTQPSAQEINSEFSNSPLRLQVFILATGVVYFIFAYFVPTMSAMRNWLATSAVLTVTYDVVLVAILVKDGTLPLHLPLCLSDSMHLTLRSTTKWRESEQNQGLQHPWKWSREGLQCLWRHCRYSRLQHLWPATGDPGEKEDRLGLLESLLGYAH